MLKYNSIKQELPYQLSSIDDSWYGIVDRHDMIVDRHVDMIVDRHVLPMFLVLNDEAIRKNNRVLRVYITPAKQFVIFQIIILGSLINCY